MRGGHESVLVEEAVAHLAHAGVRRILDGTVGCGGHGLALLRACPDASLLGMDRDDEALAQAAARLAVFGERVHLVRDVYSRMGAHAEALGWRTVDAVLLDIGVSSPQIDTPGRGFSFRADGPLDMRMDRRDRLTAAGIVNTWPVEELARIFREYGEERHAGRVARAIVARRAERPWARTGELAELIGGVVGWCGGLPPATRCFQALRIAVNRELDELDAGLTAGVDLLSPGARIGVISFHSLEDRMVKQRFRHEASSCICPPGLPVCMCGKVARLRLLTRKPVRPAAAECAANPRAASARLRVAERLAAPAGVAAGQAASGRDRVGWSG
ncbi:MAG: 16S rRNA (cytosine(1402)-N(4))-methyltransferase RsmH [Lentisphaeria bacterium]|nr:16S rRNA (cytosine(1402)-N(4))-methyltransferase RsmH [Lentisphaeria bacterium]